MCPREDVVMVTAVVRSNHVFVDIETFISILESANIGIRLRSDQLQRNPAQKQIAV